MMIEDWETCQLYWNQLRKYDGDEEKACQDVKNKYFNDFAKKKRFTLLPGYYPGQSLCR